MAASGCKWLQVAARGCKWLQVAASGCKWLQVAAGSKWLQVAVFAEFKIRVIFTLSVKSDVICLPKDSLSGNGFNQSCFTSAFLSAKPSLALASSSILNYLGTEDEVWWHLPLLALGLGALGVCGGLVFCWNRSRKARKIERILEEVYMELWDAWPRTVINSEDL